MVATAFSFLEYPEVSGPVLKEIFYGHFGAARHSRVHEMLITQDLHPIRYVPDCPQPGYLSITYGRTQKYTSRL